MSTQQHIKGTTETYCPMCGETSSVEVDLHGFAAWQAGELIQVAMPYLSPADREKLITGICGPCWDAMWDDED